MTSKVVLEVTGWRYVRPPHIPLGVKEFVHPCGCRDYEVKDGIWMIERCPQHEAEVNALVKRVRKEMGLK